MQDTKLKTLATKTWRFVLHFAEMCAAMCIGAAVFGALFVKAAEAVGYSQPFQQLPTLSAIVILVAMTAPMAVWMRVRRMDWRSIAEMSGAMVVETALLIAALWLGVVSTSALIPLQHALMMPAMLVPMFLRVDAYAGCHAYEPVAQAA